MNVEQILTDELRAVADAQNAPPPPEIDGLVRRADRARSQRRLRFVVTSGLVAATLVVAVTLAGHAGGPDAAPSPTHPSPANLVDRLPVGDPPAIPFLVGETLYLFDQPVTGKWWDVQTVQGTTVAVRAVPPMGKPVLFDSDLKPTHLLDDAVGTAVLSPDGTKLAWIEQVGSSALVVVYDLEAGRELGRAAFDAKLVHNEDGTQVSIRELDDDGTVVYGGGLGMTRWRPGGPAVTVQNADADAPVDGFPVGPLELHRNGDGNWGAWLSDRDGAASATTASGKRRVLDAVTFQDPTAPASRFTITLPDGYDLRTLTWESALDVLITYVDHEGAPVVRYARCNVEDRHCEHVPTPADS